VVDRRAVRRRFDLLPRRPDPGIPAARRLGRGRRGLLRGIAAVHLRGGLQWLETINANWGPDQAARQRLKVLTFEPRRIDWWSCGFQLIGTLYFNATTFRALQTGLDSPSYDRLVWRPDALGSICFLISGYLAYVEVTGHLLGRPRRTLESAIATVNLLGCVAFGVSAVASHVVPTTGEERNLAVVNIFTSLGALCFLIGSLLMLPEGASDTAAKATNTIRDKGEESRP
jgi:hypothetical protein